MMSFSPMTFSAQTNDHAADLLESKNLAELKAAALRTLIEKDHSIVQEMDTDKSERLWKEWMETRSDIICLLSSIHEQEKKIKWSRYDADAKPSLDKHYKDCGEFYFLRTCDRSIVHTPWIPSGPRFPFPAVRNKPF